MVRLLACCALASLLALAAPHAAGQGYDRYESQYGPPVDVSLSDLALGGVSYEGRSVRTKGRFEIGNEPGSSSRVYMLRELGGAVYITPVRELAGYLDSEGMALLGQEIQVTGLYQSIGAGSSAGTSTQATGIIQFWKILGPPERPTKSVLENAKSFSLESLVSNPDALDGKTVRVVGKFRGKNLYGDLPLRSQRDSDDWVIKDDVYALWVTGKKPKGDGFQLDAGLKRDTNRWLEVVGRVGTRAGVVYLQAIHVALGKEPRPEAEVKAPPPPPEKPKLAPVVVFVMPLEGDREIPITSRFFVQFSKDIVEESFDRRVVLRYAGAVRPGDRPFEGLMLRYDGGRRALEVDPGDDLLPGRTVEILLLPGIKDTDGLELMPRDGHELGTDPEAPVEVLRFVVGLSR